MSFPSREEGTVFLRQRNVQLGILALLVLGSVAYYATGPRGENSGEPDAFAQQLSYALVRNARHLCAVVFVVGRTPEEAMSIGDITRWSRLVEWWDWDETDIDVDLEGERVTLTRPPAPPRSAVFNDDQGCSMVPPGDDGVQFEP
ncbi:MAG: hypothetical protein ACRD2X_17090, partial [Vicinamibacteraceae bacterium]